MQPDGGYFDTPLVVRRLDDSWGLFVDGAPQQRFSARHDAEEAGHHLAAALARAGRDVRMRVLDGEGIVVRTVRVFALEADRAV